jgi:hypothetical protein
LNHSAQLQSLSFPVPVRLQEVRCAARAMLYRRRWICTIRWWSIERAADFPRCLPGCPKICINDLRIGRIERYESLRVSLLYRTFCQRIVRRRSFENSALFVSDRMDGRRGRYKYAIGFLDRLRSIRSAAHHESRRGASSSFHASVLICRCHRLSKGQGR